MDIIFRSIKDFEETYNRPSAYVMHECNCSGIREMILSDCTIKIEDKEIYIKECPTLLCQKCGEKKLGNLVPQVIYNCFFEMGEKNANRCNLTALNNKKFKYVESMDLKYDCRDLNIPGLNIDLDPTNPEGFSCPVFFEKKVLNNFLLDDEYEMDLFSETHGFIAKKGTNGWTWDWHIDFGLNDNGKIVLFLGDLEQLSDDNRAILWLKSYNVESDHTIVGSELYKAQLLNQFSNPIIEQRLIELRNTFFKKITVKYGVDLFHLEQAFEAASKELSKPINYTKQEIKTNIVTLDNLLNDAINCDKLRELYEKIVKPTKNDYKQYRSIKLLLGILAMNLSEEQTGIIISPLFNLKDLRDCYSHILPTDKVDKIKQRIVETYTLNNFEEYEKLYNSLVLKLYNLFKYLNYAEI